MCSMRTFKVSGVNIRAHTEHSPAEYVALWKALFATKLYVTQSSNALMIGDIRPTTDADPGDSICGNFYRFLEVDISNPWFDIDRHKVAADKDVEQVNIPAGLKPDLVEIPYIFDVNRHRLYFVSAETDVSLSPRTVHKLLEFLCGKESITARFGYVDLTVLTDRKEVEEMLAWPVLTSITIRVDRPNPTEAEDEEFFYERLESIGAASETRIFRKAEDAASIAPDDEIRKMAHIAADNGSVDIVGKDAQNAPIKASSKDYPLQVRSRYDTKNMTLTDAFKMLIRSLVTRK